MVRLCTQHVDCAFLNRSRHGSIDLYAVAALLHANEAPAAVLSIPVTVDGISHQFDVSPTLTIGRILRQTQCE